MNILDAIDTHRLCAVLICSDIAFSCAYSPGGELPQSEEAFVSPEDLEELSLYVRWENGE